MVTEYKCKTCNDTGQILGYGYRNEGGLVTQYERIMACPDCNKTKWTASTTIGQE